MFILPKRKLTGMLSMQETKFDNRGCFNLLHKDKDEIRPEMKFDR